MTVPPPSSTPIERQSRDGCGWAGARCGATGERLGEGEGPGPSSESPVAGALDVVEQGRVDEAAAARAGCRHRRGKPAQQRARRHLVAGVAVEAGQFALLAEPREPAVGVEQLRARLVRRLLAVPVSRRGHGSSRCRRSTRSCGVLRCSRLAGRDRGGFWFDGSTIPVPVRLRSDSSSTGSTSGSTVFVFALSSSLPRRWTVPRSRCWRPLPPRSPWPGAGWRRRFALATVEDVSPSTGSLPVAICTKTIPQSSAKQISEIATTRPRSSPAFSRWARRRRRASRLRSCFSNLSMVTPSSGCENGPLNAG